VSIWILLLVICLAGAIGGVINALLTDNGFLIPRTEESDQVKIVRPGFLGNILISAVSAAISWGLYGPFNITIVLGPAPVSSTPQAQPNLTLSALVGAVLVGVAGARWLTNEVDKKLLRSAASDAASGPSEPGATKKLLMATPAQAFFIAKDIKQAQE
jgi:hypothetical protein